MFNLGGNSIYYLLISFHFIRTCCEIVLEVATIGSIGRSLSQCSVETDPFLISSDIIPFISGLLDPAPLFTQLLPFTQKRRVGFNKQRYES